MPWAKHEVGLWLSLASWDSIGMMETTTMGYIRIIRYILGLYRLSWGYIMENQMETTIMENQMEKKMEDEMETGII